MITFQEFTALLEVVVWPATLLLVIIIYKKNFSSAFQRLGSLKADATGISLTFDQKIESAKELARAVQAKVVAKDGASIVPSAKTSPHYQKLQELKVALDTKLMAIADQNEMVTEDVKGSKLLDKLTENGSITLQHARLIDAIYDLIDSASERISKKQVAEVEALIQSLPG